MTSAKRSYEHAPAVLVLGSDERAFLTAVRSFGRAGFAVDAAWCGPADGIAMASRYIRERIDLPAYAADDDRWLTHLNALVEDRDYAFILPCHDPQVLPLQSHRHRLRRPERYALVPEAAFRSASDKGQLHAIAARLGVPVPEQRVVHDHEEAKRATDEFGFPIYVKPPRSTEADSPGARREVLRIGDQAGLAKLPASDLAQGYLVQRNVRGRGVGVDLLAFEGEILTAVQHERVHEPPAGGGSSYRRSVPMDPHLLEYSSRLMRELRYTGAAMVEFKVEGDRPYLMEINARLWGSLALTVAAGIDIPLFWYQMLREGRREFPKAYRTNVYCRHWTGERHWLPLNLAALRKPEPCLITTPLWRMASELMNIPLGRERSDTFAFDDARPAWREASRIVRGVVEPRLNRSWAGRLLHRRRSLAIVRNANSFLFVCYGNICRSPFAEAVARRLLDADARSAGVHPVTGRSSPREAQQAAELAGYDLGGHRSVLLTRDMIADADAVVVFDRSNLKAVLEVDPSAGSKIVYLGAFGRSLEIEDPFGQPVRIFSQRYDAIEQCLRTISGLRGPARAAKAQLASSS